MRHPGEQAGRADRRAGGRDGGSRRWLLEIPSAEYISVFAEGRVGLAFDAAGEGSSNGVDFDNVGGASGSAGLRFRF